MQVWIIRNSETDVHVFDRFEHLEPSVRISYHKKSELHVEVIRDQGTAKFRVSYDGKVQDEIIAVMYPVWDAPCHL